MRLRRAALRTLLRRAVLRMLLRRAVLRTAGFGNGGGKARGDRHGRGR